MACRPIWKMAQTTTCWHQKNTNGCPATQPLRWQYSRIEGSSELQAIARLGNPFHPDRYLSWMACLPALHGRPPPCPWPRSSCNNGSSFLPLCVGQITRIYVLKRFASNSHAYSLQGLLFIRSWIDS